jgi:DNA-binding transcriptional LysR family regulator
MLLRQLEYFSALAGGRHFGRAAVACRVSQSTARRGAEADPLVAAAARPR